MEKNFYRDQFEQMLKDTTDSFRLYPSRKIWHSIYNDLHPAKKWPSFAVLLLLTASIMYIGVTNPTTSKNALNSKEKNTNTNVLASLSNENLDETYSQTIPVVSLADVSNTTKAVMPVSNKIASNSSSTAVKPFQNTTRRNNRWKTSEAGKVTMKIKAAEITTESTATSASTNAETTTTIEENAIALYESESNEIATAFQNIVPDYTAIENKEDKSELEWKEDMAFHNTTRSRKLDKWAFQFYATPSMGFRTLTKREEYNENSRTALVTNPDQDEYFLNHSSTLNMEAGGGVLYNLSKKIRLKAGIQFNYTNYLINAYALNHPVLSSVLLADVNTGLPAVVSYSTSISNSQGLADTYYNNKTMQLSLPVGADFEIAGNNKVKLFAGATIQPTYNSSGNAYLISTDMKNYINDPSMIRKFNINAGIETFVSYQLNKGVSLSAGPQFRYQFLSTYSNQYSYNERLYNVGLKFGITSKF